MNAKNYRAFSLIEVMIALAILAIAISSLLVVRNEAIERTGKSIELRRLRALAQEQMGKISAGLEKRSSGNFSKKGLPKFLWKVSIKKSKPLTVQDSDGQVYQIYLDKVTLIVKNTAGDGERMKLIGYFPIERPEGK